jgi:hypothetical protein
MSKIALSGNSLGSGTLTISAPNTNVDRVLELPDSAGTIATAESTLAQFSASGSAPVYACRAWVNFDGRSASLGIRASGNVSSVTRNSAGNYTVNFATAMPDANYCVAPGVSFQAPGSGNGTTARADSLTTTSVLITTRNASGDPFDTQDIFVSIFR